MKNNRSIFIRIMMNPWVYGIGTTIIAAILVPSGVVSLSARISLFAAVSRIFGIIYLSVTRFFHLTVPIWAVFTVVSVVLVLFWLVRLIFRTRPLPVSEGQIGDYYFRWHWIKRRDNSLYVDDIVPHCIGCKCELSKSSGYDQPFSDESHFFYCPACGKKYPPIYDKGIEDVGKIIQSKLSPPVQGNSYRAP